MNTHQAARTTRGLTCALLGGLAALLAACSAPQRAAPTSELVFAAPSAGRPLAPTPSPPPVVAPPPLDVALGQAVVALAGSWVEGLEPPAGTARRALVALPFIDVATGSPHSLSAHIESSVLTELRALGGPRLDVLPFTPNALSRTPWLLTGTLTRPVPGSAGDAMTMCLVMIDTRDGRVVAQATARARAGGVAIPPAIVRDAPVWIRDAAVDAQVRACREARVGGKVDAAFLSALPVAARMATASEHYGAGRLAAARTELRAALALPGGQRADVLNGLYLTEWRLKRSKEAELAFGDLVAHGMATRRMGLLLPFKADAAELPTGKQLTQPLPMWWKQIALRVPQKGGTCLDISGHASSGGGDDADESLSFRRAFAVRTQLIERSPQLGTATVVNGVGNRQRLVGSGANDASDALDRRVELRLKDC